MNNVKKTLRAKSLYNNKKTQSLKVKKNTPIMDTFDYWWRINKTKGLDSEFRPPVSKFFKFKEINYPGPGKYYRNENNVDYNDRNKIKTSSYFFKNPQKKKIDYLEKYEIKTKKSPNDLTFKIKKKVLLKIH